MRPYTSGFNAMVVGQGVREVPESLLGVKSTEEHVRSYGHQTFMTDGLCVSGSGTNFVLREHPEDEWLCDIRHVESGMKKSRDLSKPRPKI